MRPLAVVLFAVLFLACASGSSDADAPPQAQPGPPIGVTFRQINGSPELYRHAGPVGVQYVVTITNPGTEPFLVERVEVRSTVPGAYALRDSNPTRVNRTIPPNMGLNVPLTAWGVARGGQAQMEEPVTVAVAVYGSGADQKSVVKRVQRTITSFHEE